MSATNRTYFWIVFAAALFIAGALAPLAGDGPLNLNVPLAGTRVNTIPVLNATDVTPASGFYDQGDTNVEMVYINLTGTGGGPTSAEDVTGIELNHTGTGAATDITEVTVYEDVDQDGVLEPTLDDGGPLGKSSTWTNSHYMAITFDYNLNIVRDSLHNLWVVYNFSATATGTHGLRIDAVDNITASIPLVTDPNGKLPCQSTNLSLNPGPLDYNVTGAATFLSATPTTNFYSGQDVEVSVKARHSWTETDITGARITITGPGSVVVVNDQPMTQSAAGAGFKDYTYTYALPTPSPRGAYTADITGDFAQGTDTDQTAFNVINSLPQITGALGPYQVQEDAPGWQANLTGMKSDLEDAGAALVWSVSQVNTSLLTVAVYNTDFLNFTLKPEVSGSNLVNLTLTDSDLGADTVQFWVNVTSVNDPPVIAPIPDQNATEDQANWTLNLTGYRSDAEGGPLAWGVSDVNASLFQAALDNDSLTFSLVENAYGMDDINITLTDSGNSTVWQWVTVNITPVNDAPVWEAVDDVYITGNGTNFTAVLSLADFASDVDGDLLAFSLVSATNSTEVAVAVAADGKVDVTILNKSFTGISRVVVNATDGIDAPQAGFDVIVTGGQTLALEAELLSPAKGATLNNLSVTLKWNVTKKVGITSAVKFDVYLGTVEANVTALDPSVKAASGVTESKYAATLEDNTTYYWTVVPSGGSFTGTCVSGTWDFSVDTAFVVLRNVSIQADKESVKLRPGQNATVALSVTNHGNDIDIVTLTVDAGGLPGTAALEGAPVSLTLAVGASGNATLLLAIPAGAAAGTYTVTATAASQDAAVFDAATIQVEVEDTSVVNETDQDADGLPDQWEIDHFGNLDQTATGDPDGDGKNNLQEYTDGTDPMVKDGDDDTDDDDDDDDEKGSWVFWIVALIIAGLIVVVVIVLVIRKNKEESEKKDFEGREEEEHFEEEEEEGSDEEPEEAEDEEELTQEEVEDLEADIDEMEKEMESLGEDMEDLPPAAQHVPDEVVEPEDEKLPEWEGGEEEGGEPVTGEPHVEESEA